MTTILLIRHGENEWVNQHRLAGWTEGVHLNENGHQQAKALAARLAELPLEAVYSSPLVRCRETAAHIAAPHTLPTVILERIGEVRYGAWRGAEIKELAKLPEWKAVQFFPSRFEFPDGEALRTVQSRAVNQLESLCHTYPDKAVAVVSHADLIKLVLAHYLGVHMDLFQRIQVSPASVSILHLMKGGGMRILRMNDTGPIVIPKPPPSTEKENQNESES